MKFGPGNRWVWFAGVAGVITLCAAAVWNSRAGQDWLLDKAATAALSRSQAPEKFDGLSVFFCGTSSPIPDPNRAQACVAIFAGESLFLVDAGAGSARVAALARLPLERLRGVFLTHYHSDHIAALPDFNLNSWVAGRPEPLAVFGPSGVTRVVDGLNEAYRLDRAYRVAHHGAALLPPELGVMEARLLEPGTRLNFGGLSVSSFPVDHSPVHPAVGYRFEYRGRSLVISGDTVVSDSLIKAAAGADLLIQDSLSPPIVKALEKAAAGSRLEKIFFDIQDYHAHSDDLSPLVRESGVRQLVLYHLVPPPRNALFKKIFKRDLPAGTVIAEDGMIVELPAQTDDIVITKP